MILNRFKKLPLIFTLFLLLFSSIFTGFVHAEDTGKSKNSDFTLSHISSDEIDSYPDVEKFIQENGLSSYIIDGDNSNDKELISLFQLENKVTLPDISNDELNRLEREYGLEIPDTEIYNTTQDILIQRSNSDLSILGAWLINYFETNTGFTITLSGIGNSPMYFSGTLKNYRANGSSWTLDATKDFTKTVTKNGIVYTWAHGRAYVSDYFTYNLRVAVDGVGYNYSRTDRFYQRYYSVANAYNKLTAAGGERHHFVSANALSSTGFNSSTAPAVRMMRDDHLKTPSWGSSAAASAFRTSEINYIRKKDFKGLLQFEVNGLKAAPDPEGKFPNLQQKYLYSVAEALLLAEAYFGI